MTEVTDKIRIYLSHGDAGTSKVLEAIITKLGHEIHGISDTCKKTYSDCIENPPDLILSGVEYEDGDGLENLIAISRKKTLPSIVVTRKDSLDKVEKAMDDHVMAYMIEPVNSDELKPAIYVVLRRFEQLKQLEEENESLKDALASRKKVERAKGILMAKKGWSEEEAYLYLRKAATSNRIKMDSVADIVIETETKS